MYVFIHSFAEIDRGGRLFSERGDSETLFPQCAKALCPKRRKRNHGRSLAKKNRHKSIAPAISQSLWHLNVLRFLEVETLDTYTMTETYEDYERVSA